MNNYTSFPKSATNVYINLIGLASFLTAFFILMKYPYISTDIKVIIILACWSVPIIILEYIFLKPLQNTAVFHWQNFGKLNFKRSLLKILGLFFTLLTVALFYWIPPEYHGSFYTPYWNILKLTLPTVLILAIPYIILLDSVLVKPEDSYYHLGLYIIGKNKHVDKNILIQHFLGWLVKAYFLPLMTVYFSDNIQNVHPDFNRIIHDFHFQYFFDSVWDICFTIDLGIVCAGYALTLKAFDSHIRSTEPTTLGWVVALICYQPFWNLFSEYYLLYNRDNYNWGNWLGNYPSLYTIWGSLILFAIIIYTLASVNFGIRFSNLTHRGILTNGVYRYTKHPAYLSKNLSWWLITIPFITVNGEYAESIRNIFMLIGVNFVYYIRAKTEERHLAQDPVYREYMSAIAQHGLIAKIKQVFKRAFTRIHTFIM